MSISYDDNHYITSNDGNHYPSNLYSDKKALKSYQIYSTNFLIRYFLYYLINSKKFSIYIYIYIYIYWKFIIMLLCLFSIISFFVFNDSFSLVNVAISIDRPLYLHYSVGKQLYLNYYHDCRHFRVICVRVSDFKSCEFCRHLRIVLFCHADASDMYFKGLALLYLNVWERSHVWCSTWTASLSQNMGHLLTFS